MPKLGTHALNYTGYNTYMPFFFVHKEGRYRDYIIWRYYGDIMVMEKIRDIGTVILYVIGAILCAIAIGFMVRRYVDQKRKTD
jgi:hypothetical protein